MLRQHFDKLSVTLQHDSREIIINLKSFSPGVYFI